MPARIEIFKDALGQWRFRVRAKNRQIIAQSEGYTRKHSCKQGVLALRKIMGDYTTKIYNVETKRLEFWLKT